MISKKHSLAAKSNIKKAIFSGKSIHIGNRNGRWKGGVRGLGNYPCPKCNKNRVCEKRNAYRLCWDCHINRPKEFSRKEWHKKTKFDTKKWAIEYKGGKCVICGISNLPEVCYQFHHKNRNEKIDNPGHLMRQKPSIKLKNELDKCVLVCANCHMIIEHTDITALTYS